MQGDDVLARSLYPALRARSTAASAHERGTAAGLDRAVDAGHARAAEQARTAAALRQPAESLAAVYRPAVGRHAVDVEYVGDRRGKDRTMRETTTVRRRAESGSGSRADSGSGSGVESGSGSRSGARRLTPGNAS